MELRSGLFLFDDTLVLHCTYLIKSLLKTAINLLKEHNKKIFKESIQNFYEKVIFKKLQSFDNSSKLFLYSKLNTNIEFEKYLSLENFNSRQLLTKFRISDHALEVEVGRYKKIPRELRLCKICKLIDDEEHFFLHCQINSDLRNHLFNKIANCYSNFNQLDPCSKLKFFIKSYRWCLV